MGLKWAQDMSELDGFLNAIQRNKCASALEIGSRYGDTLYEIAHALPAGSRVVSVELADGPWGRPDSLPELQSVIQTLNSEGYDAHLILGNSRDPAVIRQAAELGNYDVILIDGDHSFEGVSHDWQRYNYLANKMVAFHDIIARKLGVMPFWEALRLQNPEATFEEFTDSRGSSNEMGIGVIYRSSD